MPPCRGTMARSSAVDPPHRTCRSAARLGSVESEDGDEGLVDGPHLGHGEPSDTASEPLHTHRAQLLDQDPRRRSGNLDLRAERGRPCAARRRCDDHDRTRQHHIGLDHDAEALALLLVADALRTG